MTSFSPSLTLGSMAALTATGSMVEEYFTVEEGLKIAFPAADAFESGTSIFSKTEREALGEALREMKAPRLLRYTVAKHKDKVLGYAVVADCLGKSEPITHLVAFSPQLKVKHVEILVYRESHGYEIRHPRFREQFVGKKWNSKLRIDTDIRNIAGATISCRSLTDSVHDLLQIMNRALGPETRTETSARVPAQIETTSSTGLTAAATTPLLTRHQFHMGTVLSLTMAAADRKTMLDASSAAFAKVAELESLWSLYRTHSEVSALNRAAGRHPVSLSEPTVRLLRRAKSLAAWTLEAFDPTAAPLNAVPRTPSQEPVDETAALRALARVGCEFLTLGDGEGFLELPGAAVDVGGIGKGEALRYAARTLRSAGVESALLNFGGQLLALAPPPDATAWLAHSVLPGEQDLVSVPLVNESMATSANDQRGRSAAHLLDPRSGRPCQDLDSVTVFDQDPLLADAMSTALFVLGNAAREFAVHHAIDCWIVPRPGPGATQLPFLTRSFRKLNS